MFRDPIVEEVRAIREAFTKEHGYDVQAIVRALQREEAKSGRQVVSLPPRRLRKKQPERKDGWWRPNGRWRIVVIDRESSTSFRMAPR